MVWVWEVKLQCCANIQILSLLSVSDLWNGFYLTTSITVTSHRLKTTKKQVYCSFRGVFCRDLKSFALSTHTEEKTWFSLSRHFNYWPHSLAGRLLILYSLLYRVISASSRGSAAFSSVAFGFTVSFWPHTLKMEMWWSEAWQRMYKYYRCLSCGPACKMSFVRQVMVRFWLADALSLFGVHCMLIGLGEEEEMMQAFVYQCAAVVCVCVYYIHIFMYTLCFCPRL